MILVMILIKIFDNGKKHDLKIKKKRKKRQPWSLWFSSPFIIEKKQRIINTLIANMEGFEMLVIDWKWLDLASCSFEIKQKKAATAFN